MVRRKPRPVIEGELRAYLLAEAVAFRDQYGGISPECWAELSKPIERLAGGEVYQLHRYELPADHPERNTGWPADDLTLADDRLSVHDDHGVAVNRVARSRDCEGATSGRSFPFDVCHSIDGSGQSRGSRSEC